jgi:hypothetical protein
MEFFREGTVSSRKERQCDACGTMIDPGERHTYMAAKYDGQFYTMRNHAECREAECALAKLHDLYGGDDGWIMLSDMDEPDDLAFLKEHHPVAYARVAPRYAHWETGE